jgi:hypothetical protein
VKNKSLKEGMGVLTMQLECGLCFGNRKPSWTSEFFDRFLRLANDNTQIGILFLHCLMIRVSQVPHFEVSCSL